MVDRESLRPVERRVLRLTDEGVDTTEIARRFHRSPEAVDRMVDYTNVPRAAAPHDVAVLRPLERRILKWRAQGSNHAEIGRRFHRSAGHVERVEQLANYKLRAGA
jgi:DNA-binding CsgD family transcriptional regulator